MHFKLSNIYVLMFVYIVVVNIAVALSTLALHELGHMVVGSYLGCSNIRIVLLDLDSLGTFTQMNCPSPIPGMAILGSAFALVAPFSAALYFLKDFSERSLWAVAIGFNLMLASIDVLQAFQTMLAVGVLNILGISMIAVAEYFFVQRLLDNAESKTLIVRV